MKPYSGPPDETCPYRLGELCSTACPTCKFQQPFEVPDVPGITWQCSLFMQHVLTIENTRAAKRVSSEIEAFRNETVEQNRALISGSVKIAQQALTAAEIYALRGGAQEVLRALPAPDIGG